MPLVSYKGTLAIAAVIDVAINSASRRVSMKELAKRHKLSPRYLEPVLQALVHDGILKGIRSPHGGYEVAREPAKIAVEDILKSAGRIEEAQEPLPDSGLVVAVVQPLLAVAERSFSAALRQISVADLVRQAFEVQPSALFRRP